jgi:uncharacterized membrane protein YhaH (DUF805 family)
MSVGRILFGLSGRLNRRPYWIASIIFLALIILVTIGSVLVNAQMMQAAFESGGSIEAPTQLTTFLILGTGLLLAYPSTAVMVKRFHDLGKSGKWALLLLVPALGKMATDLSGFTGQDIPLSAYDFDGTESWLEAWKEGIRVELDIRPVEFVVGLYIFVVTVWFFIWLGFFRGTRGPNRFGPDPLASEHQA